MSEIQSAVKAEHVSRVYLTSAGTADLPSEAVCLLTAAAVEKAIEAVFWVNGLTPPNRDQALFVFTEQFVLNGGFPRGIERDIYSLYRMRDGSEQLASDGGLTVARSVLKELHRTIKGWIKEKGGA